MKLKDRLEKEAAKYGATVDYSSEKEGFINIDAPKSKVWACDCVHALHVDFENSQGQRWTKEAFEDAIERMSYGLADCEEEACETCKDEVNRRES